MKQKTMLCLLMLILSVFLISCGTNGQEQVLGKTTGSQKITEDSSKDIFEEPVVSDVDEIVNPIANMKMSIPKNWIVTWNSDRDIVFNTSSGDVISSRTSIHLLYALNYVAPPEETPSAFNYVDLFKDELYQASYMIDGVSYSLTSYQEPSFDTNNEYVKENKDKVACTITRGVHASSSEMSYSGVLTQINYYVLWENRPLVLSCIVDDENTENMKEQLENLVRSIKYCKQSISEKGVTEEVKKGTGVTLSLPHQFTPSEASNKTNRIYSVPVDSKTAFSGMSVGIFPLSTEESFNIDDITLEEQYGESLLKTVLEQDSDLILPLNCTKGEQKQVGSYTIQEYDGDYSILASGYNHNSFYSIGDVWNAKFYQVTNEDKSEIIVFTYQPCQKELAEEILSSMFR